MPTEKTKADYRKLAANFYAKRLQGEQPTPKKIADALAACAHEYRPAYWRRLRNALELDQREKGYKDAAERIAGTRNPLTTTATGEGIIDPALRGETPPKQRRAKSIRPDDARHLRDTLLERGQAAATEAEKRRYQETLGAVLLAEQLGVRPAEMPYLRIEGGRVYVTGAKKTGERGADRVLTLPDDPEMRVALPGAAKLLHGAGPEVMRRIQSRLDRLTRELWPRRQARPTLYTYRHQMGGNLKGMGLDRRAIAYIMGHQSTKSVEVYGDRRKGSGGIGIKLSGQEAKAFQGRENHTAAPDGLPESKIPPALRAVAQSLKSETPETPVQQEKPAKPAASPSSQGFRGPRGPGM